ncbi:MAG: hypothetical protein OXH08_16665 [Gammaproteobacteria bacterium]|nr:hypothetical protein [Gammaproteobacteria bacterium]
MSKRVSRQGDSRSMPASAAIQAVLLLCACGEADRPGEASDLLVRMNAWRIAKLRLSTDE